MDVLTNILMFTLKVATFPIVWIIAELIVGATIASIYELYQWKKYKKICTERVETISYFSVMIGFFITLMLY